MDKRKTEVYVAGRKVERIYLCNILHYTKFPKLTQRFKPYADLSSHQGLSGGIPGGSSSSQLSARAQGDRREHSGSVHVPSEPQTAHKSRAGYLWLKRARRKSRIDLYEANEPSVPPLQALVQGRSKDTFDLTRQAGRQLLCILHHFKTMTNVLNQ